MPTLEQIAARRVHDEARLKTCARIEELLDTVANLFPEMPLRELAQHLPPEQATHLLSLVDELEIQSRECGAVEVQG
jgi:hypothetical protein